jgi:hypothetical protein
MSEGTTRRAALIAGAGAFSVMASWYVLRPVRDAMARPAICRASSS